MTEVKFWNTKKLSDTVGMLQLYGPIADERSWGGSEITPTQLAKDLKALGDISQLDVRINSGGGNVFAGQAIYAMLKAHKANVTVYVDGLAASIASIIAMAGDQIVMYHGSMLMVHNPWTSVRGGDANEMRHTATVLDKVRDAILATYQARTGISAQKLIAMMDAETWLTAKEAVSMGFATQIVEDMQIAASIKDDNLILNGIAFNMSGYVRGKEVMDRVKNTMKGDKSMSLENVIAQLPKEQQDVVKLVAQAALTVLNEPEPEQPTEPVVEPEAPAAEPEVEPAAEPEAEPVVEPEAPAAEPEVEPATEPAAPDTTSDALIASLRLEIAQSKEREQAAIAKLRETEDQKELALYIAKAATLDRLPLSAEEFGPIFRNFARVDKEGYLKLEAMLVAANNCVENGALFSVAGSSVATASSAWDKLQLEAKKIVQTDPSMGKEKALLQAMRANPDLYNAYLTEEHNHNVAAVVEE